MEKKGEDVPLLVAQTGPLNGLRWPLRSLLIIGREPGCDIEIPDRQVSRHHARIIPTAEALNLKIWAAKTGLTTMACRWRRLSY